MKKTVVVLISMCMLGGCGLKQLEPTWVRELGCWTCYYSSDPMKCADLDMDKIHGHHHPSCEELDRQRFTRQNCNCD